MGELSLAAHKAKMFLKVALRRVEGLTFLYNHDDNVEVPPSYIYDRLTDIESDLRDSLSMIQTCEYIAEKREEGAIDG